MYLIRFPYLDKYKKLLKLDELCNEFETKVLSNSLFVRMWHTLLNHIKFGRKVTQLIQIGILK